MAGKPILHYSNDRGRMESIRWLLAAAAVETKGTLFLDTQSWTISGSLVCQRGPERDNFRFEEKYIETRQDLEKLRNDGVLVFQQVPMVEIDGMKLVQTRAILNYIASKYNLYGKDIKERALIDMYAEGIADLNELIILYPFRAPGEKDANFTQIQDKARNRYFPAFEKVLKSHGQDYLVGNKLSKVDIHLAELLYNMEELDPSIITSFPLLQALRTRISSLPTVKKFLQPGSQRKPPVDDKCVEKVFKIFH